MSNTDPLNCHYYSEADIKAIAKIFGMDCTDRDSLVSLCERMERTAFYYKLALEDKEIEPRLPASKATQTAASPAKLFEDGASKVRAFPRQLSSDLIRVANELGDKKDERLGANRFFKTLDDVQWIIACLRELEKEYKENKSNSGGNRPDEARNRFYDALHKIVLDFNGKPLTLWLDPYEPELELQVKGQALDLIEICFKPFPTDAKYASLARVYARRVGQSVASRG